MINLKHKTAIVTGSSRGLGKTVAKLLAQNGANVIINYSSNKEQADEVVSEIKQSGGRAFAIQADISKPTEISKLFDMITFDNTNKFSVNVWTYSDGDPPAFFFSEMIYDDQSLNDLRSKCPISCQMNPASFSIIF